MTKSGIIYLIQPSELVGTDRYKIGCSSNRNLERCKNGYKNGSRYLCIMDCVDPFGLERKIINEFNNKFKLISGREYYKGNELDMIKIFFDITYKHMKDVIINKIDSDSESDSNIDRSELETDSESDDESDDEKDSSNNIKIIKVKKNENTNDKEIIKNKQNIKDSKDFNDKYYYSCEKCGKIFKQKYLLTRHLNKKFPCDKIDTINNYHLKIIDRIDDEISKKTELSLETKTKCLFCDSVLINKGNLTRHLNNFCCVKKELLKEKQKIIKKKEKLIEDKNIKKEIGRAHV